MVDPVRATPENLIDILHHLLVEHDEVNVADLDPETWDKFAEIAGKFNDHLKDIEEKELPASNFGVREVQEGVFICLLMHHGHPYVFRFAYPTEEKAEEIRARLNDSFRGDPLDVTTNYWDYPKETKLRFAEMDNGNFHVFLTTR